MLFLCLTISNVCFGAPLGRHSQSPLTMNLRCASQNVGDAINCYSLEELLGQVIDDDLEYLQWLRLQNPVRIVENNDFIIPPNGVSNIAQHGVVGSSACVSGCAQGMMMSNDDAPDRPPNQVTAVRTHRAMEQTLADQPHDQPPDQQPDQPPDEFHQLMDVEQPPADQPPDEPPPPAKRRRNSFKQKDEHLFYDRGLKDLTPQTMRLPLVMGAIISAMKFCGGPNLMNTQEYTKEYGVEVPRLFHAYHSDDMTLILPDDMVRPPMIARLHMIPQICGKILS